MNPVYNEYLEFLQEKGVNTEKYELKEGFYWLDRMIIKGFDKDGNTHKILRIKVDEDMNITSKDYGDLPSKELISWEELYAIQEVRINELEKESIETTKELLNDFKDSKAYICHSGGKDSTVLMNIVRKVDNKIPILFNNTTNESADTYKLIKNIENRRMLHPKISFIDYCKQENFVPSRLKRSCCGVYKHNLTLDNLEHDKKYLLFMGIRNSESNNRSQYQTIHNFDYYPKGWTSGLSIRKWTELDIWLYILGNKIEFNEIYKKGYSRCGCIICPYRSNFEEQLTKHFFPSQLSRFKTVQENYFFEHQRWIGLNCTLDEFMNKGAWKGGLYREQPTPEVVREFAKHKGIAESVAEKYFEKKCSECDKPVRQADTLAMNLKYLGRNTSKVYCKKHLKEYLSELTGEKFTDEKWNTTVQEFKATGCDLF